MNLALIGVGEMGGPIARNLLNAGYSLSVCDIDFERLAAAAALGAKPLKSAAEAVKTGDVVLTSLPSSESFVETADRHLVPNARAGQIFVDLGTNVPAETRRISAALRTKGAFLLDVPVSGGPYGAEHADLYMFAGGDEGIFAKIRPLLEKIGKPERITYCGPSGNGHVAKGVNQLAMGLGTAAFIEAMAFAARSGLDPALAHRAVGDPESRERWRVHFEGVAGQIAAGKGESLGVKFRELPYFLREAREAGFALPLTDALFRICDAGERTVIDDHRPAPSFWRELERAKPG